MSLRANFKIARDGFALDARFEAPASRVTALFGPSGAGKTTLLRCIAGLERADSGDFEIAGAKWQDDAARLFLPPQRRRVGYVFQEPSLFDHLSVRGNLEYGMKRTPPAERRVEFDWAVDALGLAALLHRRPHALSGGQQKRVAIARALLGSPKLLLLDEPLSGLDAAGRAEILPRLERLAGELSIPAIYVSHDIEELAGIAEHILLIDGGRIAAAGPFLETLTRLDLPLSRGLDAGAVLEARVAEHLEEEGLTRLELAHVAPPQSLLAPLQPLPLGSAVRLRIAARDVSLALDPPSRTSVINLLDTTIEEVAEDPPSQATVRPALGGAPLLARITIRSARQLSLAPGMKACAQVKGVALVRR